MKIWVSDIYACKFWFISVSISRVFCSELIARPATFSGKSLTYSSINPCWSKGLQLCLISISRAHMEDHHPI